MSTYQICSLLSQTADMNTPSLFRQQIKMVINAAQIWGAVCIYQNTCIIRRQWMSPTIYKNVATIYWMWYIKSCQWFTKSCWQIIELYWWLAECIRLNYADDLLNSCNDFSGILPQIYLYMSIHSMHRHWVFLQKWIFYIRYCIHCYFAFGCTHHYLSVGMRYLLI